MAAGNICLLISHFLVPLQAGTDIDQGAFRRCYSQFRERQQMAELFSELGSEELHCETT